MVPWFSYLLTRLSPKEISHVRAIIDQRCFVTRHRSGCQPNVVFQQQQKQVVRVQFRSNISRLTDV